VAVSSDSRAPQSNRGPARSAGQRKEQLSVLLLAVLMAVIGVAWLEPWMMWATRNADPARTEPLLPPLLMIAIVLLSAAITRWAATRSHLWKDMALRVVLAAFAALILVQVIVFGARSPLDFLTAFIRWNGFASAEVIVLVFTGILWLRGILIGRADVMREDLESMFYTGVMALVVLLLFDAARPSVPFAHMLWSALIFFVASLLALALVGPEHAHFWQRETSAVRLILSRYWLLTISLVIGLIVLVGLLFAGSAQEEVYGLLRNAVIVVITALTYVIQVVLTIVLQIVVWLLTPLVPLFERLGVMLGDVLNRIRLPTGFGAADTSTQAAQAVMSSEVIAGFARSLAVLAMLMLLLLFFLLVLIRLGFIPLRRSNETHESIVSRQLLLAQLRGLFARRHGRAETRARYLALAGDDPRTAVRRAYQSLLEWAAPVAGERRPGQTPARYADRLIEAAPSQRQSIETLTRVYLHARYSALAPTAEEARQAQASLAHLQETPVIQSPLAEK
jgi:hypothetical protein